MPNPDTLLIDVKAALSLLTRLPVRLDGTVDMARAAWAWPLAGLAIALPAALIGIALAATGLPLALAAAMTLAAQLMLSGAMHEDGLADTADGLWGGWTPARRLEIMKDSAIGSYGTLALILSLVTRFALIHAALHAGLLLPVLVAAAMAARVPMASLVALLPNARDTGLSHSTGRPTQGTVIAAALLGLIPLIALHGLDATALALLLAGLTTAALGWIAQRKIGGQTGDILGAAQQLAEIAILAALLT